MTEVNMRLLTLETLLAIDEEGAQSHLVVRDVLGKYSYLPEQERSFYRRLVEGTLERRLELDGIINFFSSTKTVKMKPVIREILRMGVYQIKYMDAVPDSAAVNESVKLAVRKGFRGLRGFVNGVLRAVARGIGSVPYPDREDFLPYLEMRYSMPRTLTGTWEKRFGREITEKMCASFEDRRPLTVRIREHSGTPAHCGGGSGRQADTDNNIRRTLRELADAGIRARRASCFDDIYELTGVGDLAGLPAFSDGRLAVQDLSSVIALRAAGIREGDFVIDVCAAPGGKTVLAADLMAQRVLSRDVSGQKAELIAQNVARCGLENIVEVQVFDGRERDHALERSADVVIADVPCSGYGIIGRKPEIRYRASAEQVVALTELQRKILANAAVYVKPHGSLLFSTCTISEEENEGNVRWIEKNLGLKPVNLSGALPAEILKDARIRESAEKGYVQLLPGVQPCDGFFFARFMRPEE